MRRGIRLVLQKPLRIVPISLTSPGMCENSVHRSAFGSCPLPRLRLRRVFQIRVSCCGHGTLRCGGGQVSRRKQHIFWYEV